MRSTTWLQAANLRISRPTQGALAAVGGWAEKRLRPPVAAGGSGIRAQRLQRASVPQRSRTMTIEQCIMIILTIVIAASAVSQAVFIREQSELLRRAEALGTQVTVAITLYSYSHSHVAGSEVERTEFVGFQIVNHSVFPITISGWQLDVEQPQAQRGSTTRPLFSAVPEFGGAPLTTLKIPHRLERGEMARVLLSQDEILARLRREDGTMTRVRGQFRDTLGNTHMTPYWVEWGRDSVTTHEGPGLGYITPEKAMQRGS